MTADRLERLERRVAELEDRLAIMQLLAGYGPAVDSGAADAAAAMWTSDGSYDTYPHVLEGAAAIAGMVVGDLHATLVRRGCAHVTTTPHVALDGDHAVATFYSLLLLHEPQAEGFRVWRASANRCELVREPAGWRITHRANRVLDGGPAGRELLRPAAGP
jgi:hypothetical protein